MKTKKKKQTLSILNPNVAGIDIGSRSHYVCVPLDRCKNNIREFKVYTKDLLLLAEWLKSCNITSVVMESTGVYWIPCYEILDKAGFDIVVTNGKDCKNVPGRKTDVKDCEWLQRLHSYGLVRSSFIPEENICNLRTYLRHREDLIRCAAMHVQHMQKFLDLMNLHLHKVISSIVGSTGLKIIELIIKGERDPKKLASCRDYRMKKTEEEIADALYGNYRDDYLFCLSQAFESWKHYQAQISICDKSIEKCYTHIKSNIRANMSEYIPTSTKKKNHLSGNDFHFDAAKELYRIAGVDLTTIPGIRETTAQVIISEVGLEMSRWKNEKHFASWLGLCPNHKITGGKVKNSKTRRVANRASHALRQAAVTLQGAKNALGAFYRRIRSKKGPMKAITATAHKLARIVYRMLANGQRYVEIGLEKYEENYNKRLQHNLQMQAKQLGLDLIPMQQSLAST